jgi:hypothetical protein
MQPLRPRGFRVRLRAVLRVAGVLPDPDSPAFNPNDPVVMGLIAKAVRAENQRKMALHLTRCPRLARTS